MKKHLRITGLILIWIFQVHFSRAQTEVTFYTSMGTFVAEMYDTLQPITSGNFIDLVNAKFYDGVIFHRVINNFMIQGGDPTGTGYGGPGYTIADEFHPLASNVQRAIAMANSGPNTGGSQFYINLVNNLYLDPNHPVFGIVTSNFSVVQAIGAVQTNSNNRPVVDVVMDSVRITQTSPMSIETETGRDFILRIFPNPASGNFVIQLDDRMANENHLSLIITNVLGQTVFSQNISTSEIRVETMTWKGVYFVQITDGHNKTLDVRKVLMK
jgi:cyclophilin family peptidyl-prolyl cis-trans isomerase